MNDQSTFHFTVCYLELPSPPGPSPCSQLSEMLLRSKTRLKRTSPERSCPEISHETENTSTCESSNDQKQKKRAPGTTARKIIRNMKKSDLEGLVVRLCGEVKRLQKVLSS